MDIKSEVKTENEPLLDRVYKQWLKETKRSGSVLVGSSVREFHKWLKDNGYKLINTTTN